MPKGDRQRSVRASGYYNLSPATQQAQYDSLNSSRIPDQYYSGALTTSMPQQSYSPPHSSNYSTGGPVQHPMVAQQQYAQMASAPLTSIRASSGAWNPADDQTLMAARAQGMNWAPIQQTYFPHKTPNACRKRHERLMERRSADDWDGVKLENLAKNYMSMRREIWSGLAAQTGEKWNVVEQKCMGQGIKNLQTAARAHARRERLLDNASAGGAGAPGMLAVGSYEHPGDDSIGSIDLEAEYDPTDGGASSSGRSTSSVYGTHPGHHGHYHSHSGGSAVGSSGGYPGHQQRGQRLPSMDMGIESIINRPNNGR